ncbi:MAG: ribosomal L7Ae/L30e/S12e/Gadd45 family protein [Eubacterium sp.]|nr:ribosomal L7Ae/L30e/S12e/Gadd45 family protein [Eubacterium sp.]
MLTDKLSAYLGFAAKAGKLMNGYNTCLSLIDKRKVRLLIVAEDSSDNTKEKMQRKSRAGKTEFRIFGTSEELSRITGKTESTVFAVTDEGFAKVIRNEIDRIRSEGVIKDGE